MNYLRIRFIFIIVLIFCSFEQTFAGEAPKRIVSILPSNTEILFALGLNEQIIGISGWEDCPSEVRKKTKVGGLRPNLEAIVMLEPDLIIADISQERSLSSLKELGFHIEITHSTRAKNFADILGIIRSLGKLTGRTLEAEKIISQMKARIEKVKQNVKGLRRPKVYYEVWSHPTMGAGRETLQGKLIEEAGGINIVAELKKRNPRISTEFLLLKNPDIIVHPGIITTEQLKRRSGWSNLEAVKNNKVYIIESNVFSKAGPRIVEALQDLARILHPEAFDD